ncbi:asparagine synthase (glutamine-hydrolyzing) [Pelagibacterales bacterium SAG-MED22]|nr:asparagine synthase (glutamine-hydrolyzing) [Pelagibacterales bacterium SAG-MED22]
MCGIAGFISREFLNNQKEGISLLHKMTDALSHRGPDHRGFSVEKNFQNMIAFGHRRLSIIDLNETSNQPMSYENLIMIFNGEIYNYIEIRKKLKTKGYTFKSNGDTEVLIKAFHFWGMEALKNLNGMFAIALYDKQLKKIYLIRDRFGVKPLLYSKSQKSFYFASEARSLYLAKKYSLSCSDKSIYEYFRYGFVSNPSTIVNEVNQVRPGHYLEIDLVKNNQNEIKYWFIEKETENYLNLTDKQKFDKLDSILNSSTELRLRSDVNNLIFLSGGIDSGLIANYASKIESEIKSLTVKFQDKAFDETDIAVKTAKNLNLKHQIIEPNIEDYVQVINEMPKIWDRPIADPSTIPTFLICKYAAKSSKVVLSADGGDELFLGYNKHRIFELYKLFGNNLLYLIKFFPKNVFNNIFIFKIINKIANLHLLKNNLDHYSYLSETTDEATLKEIFSFNINSQKQKYALKQKQKFIDEEKVSFSSYDVNNFLTDNILYKIDQAAMYNSIENREPMLDYRLAALASSLSKKNKISVLHSKIILRKLYDKIKINKKNSFASKKGFVPPLVSIFRDKFSDQIIDFISSKNISNFEYLNTKKVINIRDKFISGDDKNFKILWLMFVFFKWHSFWFNR